MEAQTPPTARENRLVPILALESSRTLIFDYSKGRMNIETRPDIDDETLTSKTGNQIGISSLDLEDISALLRLTAQIEPLLS